ncbi:hypothetical protein GGU11DRAFT_452447 [Lentinula aff. detonsa]|nr:hypothetical protein GGU11DRAFT_452447 [Lentinula aff. detonsa]
MKKTSHKGADFWPVTFICWQSKPFSLQAKKKTYLARHNLSFFLDNNSVIVMRFAPTFFITGAFGLFTATYAAPLADTDLSLDGMSLRTRDQADLVSRTEQQPQQHSGGTERCQCDVTFASAKTISYVPESFTKIPSRRTPIPTTEANREFVKNKVQPLCRKGCDLVYKNTYENLGNGLISFHGIFMEGTDPVHYFCTLYRKDGMSEHAWPDRLCGSPQEDGSYLYPADAKPFPSLWEVQSDSDSD